MKTKEYVYKKNKDHKILLAWCYMLYNPHTYSQIQVWHFGDMIILVNLF